MRDGSHRSFGEARQRNPLQLSESVEPGAVTEQRSLRTHYRRGDPRVRDVTPPQLVQLDKFTENAPR